MNMQTQTTLKCILQTPLEQASWEIIIGPSLASCIITGGVSKLKLKMKIASEFLKGMIKITSVPQRPTKRPKSNWQKCLVAVPKICAILVVLKRVFLRAPYTKLRFIYDG